MKNNLIIYEDKDGITKVSVKFIDNVVNLRIAKILKNIKIY